MGLQVIDAIMGIWSEGVMGPGLMSMLWNTLLLVTTMSGEVVLLCLSKVGKSGPICLHLSMSMRVLILRRIGLWPLCPNILCVAFKSPSMYTGSSVE